MSQTPAPAVSVIIPSYNAGEFVLQAVDSVLAQQGASFRLHEVIVVDDRSTDPASQAALRQLAGRDKVRVMTNLGRKGCPGARNFGIAASDADWIALLDADDVYLPGALEAQFAAVAANPGITWVGTDFICCDAALTPTEGAFFKARAHTARFLYADDGPWTRLPQPLADFLSCNLALPSGSLIRRDRLMGMGMFDETLGKVEDIDMWLRLALTEDYLFVRTPVVYYRIHDNSMTALEPSRAWKIHVFEKQLKLPATKPLHPLIRRRIAAFMTEEGYILRQKRDAPGLWRLFRRAWSYANVAPALPMHALRQWLGLKLGR